MILLAMAILGGLPNVARWLPTSLANAMAALVRGGHASDYLPATGVAAAATVAAVAGAITLGQRREI